MHELPRCYMAKASTVEALLATTEPTTEPTLAIVLSISSSVAASCAQHTTERNVSFQRGPQGDHTTTDLCVAHKTRAARTEWKKEMTTNRK